MIIKGVVAGHRHECNPEINNEPEHNHNLKESILMEPTSKRIFDAGHCIGAYRFVYETQVCSNGLHGRNDDNERKDPKCKCIEYAEKAANQPENSEDSVS